MEISCVTSPFPKPTPERVFALLPAFWPQARLPFVLRREELRGRGELAGAARGELPPEMPGLSVSSLLHPKGN